MTPKEVIRIWIEWFNQADVEGLAELYPEDVINDQVVFSEPLQGRAATKSMFELEFSRANKESFLTTFLQLLPVI